MNIRNVREKFQHFGTLSIAQLGQVTGESTDDLVFVVKELLQRGKIEEVNMDSFCGSGCGCNSSKVESCSTMDQLYKWIA